MKSLLFAVALFGSLPLVCASVSQEEDKIALNKASEQFGILVAQNYYIAIIVGFEDGDEDAVQELIDLCAVNFYECYSPLQSQGFSEGEIGLTGYYMLSACKDGMRYFLSIGKAMRTLLTTKSKTKRLAYKNYLMGCLDHPERINKALDAISELLKNNADLCTSVKVTSYIAARGLIDHIDYELAQLESMTGSWFERSWFKFAGKAMGIC